MVNLDAQRERHAKLKGQDFDSKNTPTSFIKSEEPALTSASNPALKSLIRRAAVLTTAFMLVAPILATFQLTHGNYFDLSESNLMELTDREAEFTIADVMTEDGFLLKPAIHSAEGDRSGFSDIFVYTVEPGDTLSSIAQSFNLKKETLMGENDLWNPNRLRVGSKLKILPVDGLSHTVKKGETIDKIAKKYEVETEDIMKQNQLTEDAEILAQQVLIVPGAKKSAPVVAVATSAPSAAGSYSGPKAAGRLIWPTVGKLTQGYHRGHTALDIGNRAKGPIYAAASGKIITSKTGWNGGYGNYIIIDHGNGMQTLYGHNEKLYVTEGQYVEQGQTIAWMGRTGRVYGPTGIHLHFEVRINGVKYNPMNFF